MADLPGNAFHNLSVIAEGGNCLPRLWQEMNVSKARARRRVLSIVLLIPLCCWKYQVCTPSGAEGGGGAAVCFEGDEGFGSGLSTLNLCDSADGYLRGVQTPAFWQQPPWLSSRGY